MRDAQVPNCVFYAQFGEKCVGQFGVNPNHRRFQLSGRIWNTDDRRILGKRIDLTVARGNWTKIVLAHHETLANIAQDMGKEPSPAPDLVEGAIGRLKILKNAEPAHFETEIDGEKETFEEPPFQATIFLDAEAYGDAEKTCDEAMDAHRTILASLRVASSVFAQRPFFGPDALDYSTEITAHLVGIDLSGSIRSFLPRADRAVTVPDVLKDAKHTTLDVVFSELSVSYSMPSGRVERITCEGTTRNFRAKELHGLTCSVDFTEYERDDAGLYPEKQFSGTCAFYSENENRWFSLSLRYRAIDLDGALGGILAASKSDTVVLSISVVMDPEALKTGKQDMSGEVTYWDVRISRRFRIEATPS